MYTFVGSVSWLVSCRGPRDKAHVRSGHSIENPSVLPQSWSSSQKRRARLLSDMWMNAEATGAETKNVLVSGGTGFVGKALVRKLITSGKRVTLLSRDEERARKTFNYKVEAVRFEATGKEEPERAVINAASECDAIINLAGEPISDGRWTLPRRARILQSRVNGTRQLVRAIQRADKKPRVFISTSAVGYYGTSETITFDEDTHPAGNDFLASVAIAWEAAAQDAGVRTVINRFGIVLGPDGGALSKMLPLFNLFVGGPIGSGNQWISWIHLADLTELIMRELDSDNFSGVYNATAPHPVRFGAFCDALAKALRRPNWLPVPSLALQLILGEAAELVLKGQRVLPKRLLENGFKFQFEDVQLALEDIVASWKSPARQG